MIAHEILLGSSNYFVWASPVKLSCKGQGVQDHLKIKVGVVDEKTKPREEGVKVKKQWKKVNTQLYNLLW